MISIAGTTIPGTVPTTTVLRLTRGTVPTTEIRMARIAILGAIPTINQAGLVPSVIIMEVPIIMDGTAGMV